MYIFHPIHILILLVLGASGIVVSIVAQQLPVRCVAYWSTLRNVLEYAAQCTGVRSASYWRMLRKTLSAVAVLAISVLTMTACQQEELVPSLEQGGVLELELLRGGRPVVSTRSVDDDLAVEIRQGDEVLFSWTAGSEVPARISFKEAGSYTVRAFTNNQETWEKENDGRGAACYYAEASFEIENAKVTSLTVNVPAVNYAVSFSLPDDFNDYFTDCIFTVESGERKVPLTVGQTAYFEVSDEGFTYTFQTTNKDGEVNAQTATYKSVESGKHYNISYGSALDIEPYSL